MPVGAVIDLLGHPDHLAVVVEQRAVQQQLRPPLFVGETGADRGLVVDVRDDDHLDPDAEDDEDHHEQDPGRFDADITTESGSTTTKTFGAIVQASGYTEYDANQLPEFGYGKSPNVVTQAELDAMVAKANGIPTMNDAAADVPPGELRVFYLQSAFRMTDNAMRMGPVRVLAILDSAL